MRLLEEMKKNALSLLRSPAALVTLIIGPLTLLLLVGVTLSGTEPHGIVIGVTGPGSTSMKLNGTIEDFQTLDGCMAALRGQLIHACLEFSRFNTTNGVPHGTIIFHVDESRTQITSLVVDELSAQLGVQSSKIRIEAVKGLLDQFSQIAAFMSEKRADLVQVRQEALSLRSDVENRRVKLENEQSVYRAAYYPVRDRLTNATVSLTSVGDGLSRVLDSASGSLDALDAANAQFNATQNASFAGMNSTLPLIDTMPLRVSLTALSAQLNSSRNDSLSTNSSITTLLAGLDDIDRQLDDDINASKEYEIKIDAGVASIDSLLAQLDADIQKLSSMDPALSAQIDKPIVQQVETLFTDLRPIQGSFAQLFCIVVIFISTLFGTIVTLIEINSRAVLRNTLAPTGEGWTMAALSFTSLIVVAIQAGVLLIVAQTMLAVDVLPALGTIIPVGIILALTFISVGMAIALRLRKQQSSILVATFVALIVLMFSNLLTAIELMPQSVSSFVQYNPLIIGADVVKQAILFARPLDWAMLQPLLIWLAITIAILVAAYYKYKSQIARW
jgi:ABC-type multidrug transport system permease subunit